MSQDAGEPRRPRKRPATPTTPPIPGPGPDDDAGFGPSTFRPAAPTNPVRAPVGGGRAPRSSGADDASGTTLRREAGGPKLFERLVFGSISAGHLATFCRQAAAYLEAGVDPVKALGSLQQQFAATALGPVLGRVQAAVRRGESLDEAMAREPGAFDDQFLAMIRVAEARGGVPETLRMLSRHYEARQRMIRQARSALIYPAAVVIIGLGVGWLLTAFVLPRLVEVLQDMTRGRGASLPGPTRALMAFSDFMVWIGWWALPIGAVVGVFLLLRFYRTPTGKATIDEIGLAIPVLGPLLRNLDVARFARTLATLLEAGVDYGTSFDLTAGVVRLAPFRRALRGVRAEVLEGTTVSRALADTGRFPADVIAYVETGEDSGRLPESLDKLADEYEDRAEHMIKNLGSLVQPLIIIILGGFVFFIALALVMAYISVIANFAGGGI